jgi:hypothetical protein
MDLGWRNLGPRQDVYVRLHGPERWYRHDYSDDELFEWANRIKASGAKRAWVYFDNDNDAYAPKNALVLRRLLAGFGRGTAKRKRGPAAGKWVTRRERRSRVIEDASYKLIWGNLSPMPYVKTAKSRFARKVKDEAVTSWVKPFLVAEVKFTEWTSSGEMRHPVYLGLREDKRAGDVVREQETHGDVANCRASFARS